jgi:aspartyl/asparaginyl beta-hydroxylase (cupin superfamily)
MTVAKKKRGFRRSVIRTGKRIFRRCNDFLGRQSLVGDRPVLDNRQFPFLAEFEREWTAILAEVEPVLAQRKIIPAFHEISPDQRKISFDQSWKVLVLYGFGTRSESNCRRFPKTAALLARVPGLQSAWFSIIEPGYHIPAHRGVTKGILRAHLGLRVPQAAERCRMRVGDAVVSWQPGKSFVFDDIYEHEVWNETAEERIILLFDFDRPMRIWGRILNRLLIFTLRLSPYFRDARRNLEAWETRFDKAFADFEATMRS